MIEESARQAAIRKLYGAHFGMKGVLGADFLDLSSLDPQFVRALARAPGSALGSSRQPLLATDYDRVLEHFRRLDIRYFLYAGGNGSMETALAVDRAARQAGYEMAVIGIPKTIDNDLFGTDHTPGYASAARFFAHAARDIGEDNRSLPSSVQILEVLGRNVGWIAAATAFARHYEGDPPNLIYLPERRLALDRLCSDVDGVLRRLGRVMVVVCEGQLDPEGEPFGADVSTPNDPKRRLASNLGHRLARLVARELGVRARAEKPGLLGRASVAWVPETDREEARRCGVAAVEAAVRGETGVMISLERELPAAYRCSVKTVALDVAAGRERSLPAEWLAADAGDVAEGFLDWARPLVGPVEPHARFGATSAG